SRALDALLLRPGGAAAILDAVGEQQILSQDVPLTARQRLLEHPSQAVRGRAARLFTDLVSADREKGVAAYRTALDRKGDVGRGERQFAQHCGTCHRLGQVGQAVGPDLASVRDKPADWLLAAILNPSRAVEARYLNYEATTRDGRLF